MDGPGYWYRNNSLYIHLYFVESNRQQIVKKTNIYKQTNTQNSNEETKCTLILTLKNYRPMANIVTINNRPNNNSYLAYNGGRAHVTKDHNIMYMDMYKHMYNVYFQFCH